MVTLAEIPYIDVEPRDAQPRRIAIKTPKLHRRNVLRLAAAGGMALGITALGWLPPARRAAATAGTWWPNSDCSDSGYGYNPCGPFPYGQKWCGTDGWFKDFAARGTDGYMYTYDPLRICGAYGTKRNAWYWYYPTSGWTVRCADGLVTVWAGTPPNHTIISRVYRICSWGVRAGH
jgi:hypothetical protein